MSGNKTKRFTLIHSPSFASIIDVLSFHFVVIALYNCRHKDLFEIYNATFLV